MPHHSLECPPFCCHGFMFWFSSPDHLKMLSFCWQLFWQIHNPYHHTPSFSALICFLLLEQTLHLLLLFFALSLTVGQFRWLINTRDESEKDGFLSRTDSQIISRRVTKKKKKKKDSKHGQTNYIQPSLFQRKELLFSRILIICDKITKNNLIYSLPNLSIHLAILYLLSVLTKFWLRKTHNQILWIITTFLYGIKF